MVNIVLAIFLRFYDVKHHFAHLWPFVAWPIVLFFIIIAYLFLFCFIVKLKKYMTDVEYILNRLYEETGKALE